MTDTSDTEVTDIVGVKLMDGVEWTSLVELASRVSEVTEGKGEKVVEGVGGICSVEGDNEV